MVLVPFRVPLPFSPAYPWASIWGDGKLLEEKDEKLLHVLQHYVEVLGQLFPYLTGVSFDG